MIYRVWLSDAKGFDFCYISTKNRLEVDKLLEKYSKWENIKATKPIMYAAQINNTMLYFKIKGTIHHLSYLTQLHGPDLCVGNQRA